MTDLEDFNTVNYAAWHFPCYRKLNCPKRHYQANDQKVSSPEATTEKSDAAFAGLDLSLNLQSFEEILTFIFLFVLIAVAAIGIVSLFGALFSNRGYARPYNQFLISILSLDLLMSFIVIPIHMSQLFLNKNNPEDSSKQSCVVSCQLQLFFHLFVISARSWTITTFITLHHLHDGIIPTTHSIIVLLWTWIASAILVLPTIIVKDSFVDFQECRLLPQNFGWIIYVSAILFILPVVIVNPLLIKFLNLNKEFNIKRDISNDFLDKDDSSEDELDNVDQVLEDLNSSLSRSLSSLSHDRKASRATMAFLKTDSNMPRTLFSLEIVHLIAWLPFFTLLLTSTFADLSFMAPVAFQGILWWGFAQSVLTPGLIYMLSDRVNFLIHGQFKGAAIASLRKRVRRLTLTVA